MNQLYIHVGEVVSVCGYDSDKERTIERNVQCVQRDKCGDCMDCWFHDGDCSRIACAEVERPDGKSVYFKTL